MDQLARAGRRLPQVRADGQGPIRAPGAASGEELLTRPGGQGDPRGAGLAQTFERTVRVVNRQGLHARPAHLFVRTANGFASGITVRAGSSAEVDGKSMLGMLTLAAVHGSELTISARGPDAAEAVTALERLILAGFGED